MTAEGHSVLLVPVPALEPFVRSRWEHYDPALASTDPGFTHAHVTLLSPWLREPTAEDLDVVGGIVAETEAFGFELAEVRSFPDGIIHLRPEPAAPVARLTARLWAAFPQCPPYAGRYADVEPHLTLDLTAPGITVATTRAALADVLPVTCVADRVELHWYETGGCHVRRRWSLVDRLPVVRPRPDGVTRRAEDPEDGTDHDGDDAERPQDRDVEHGTEDQQDDTQDDHEGSPPVVRAVEGVTA